MFRELESSEFIGGSQATGLEAQEPAAETTAVHALLFCNAARAAPIDAKREPLTSYSAASSSDTSNGRVEKRQKLKGNTHFFLLVAFPLISSGLYTFISTCGRVSFLIDSQQT